MLSQMPTMPSLVYIYSTSLVYLLVSTSLLSWSSKLMAIFLCSNVVFSFDMMQLSMSPPTDVLEKVPFFFLLLFYFAWLYQDCNLSFFFFF